MVLRTVCAVVMLTGMVFSTGCSTQPPSRLDQFVGAAAPGGDAASRVSVSGPVTAGLLMVYDGAGPNSSPVLSERGKAFLADQVKARIERGTAIRLSHVLPSQGAMPATGSEGLAQWAKAQGVPYVLVALLSSAESEVPAYLPLTGDPEQGGSRPSVPGYEAVNYALAELAVIDTASGAVVARSEGRAWMRLNRLNVPIQSNAYPVIHRSMRVAPIYPPEADAKDILRSLAGDEAVEQAVARLRDAIGHS